MDESPRTIGTFPRLKRLWTILGEPLPGVTRFIRHGIIGRWKPAYAPLNTGDDARVAVIIPCHNYARYLGKAIESVLRQSHPAAEIIVVDDASEDETPEVARSYATNGVQYIRGGWRSVGKARNAGLHATSAPYLIFLDADDLLHPDYIRAGLEAFNRHPQAGIACSNYQSFGRLMQYHYTPEVAGMDEFEMWNPIHAGSMVRRQALLQVHGWSEKPDQHNDWVTWRHILQMGWKVIHSDGLYYYRMHGNSMMDGMRQNHAYAEQAGLLTGRMTLCISLSGRKWMWPLTRQFLETQTYPHDLTRLIVLDTSQDPDFGKEVRQWMSASGYTHMTYRILNVGEKGIADRPRREVEAEIGVACSIIYNTFARMVTTPLTLILEDDVLPPTDVFDRLARLLERDVVSVSGLYWHRTIRKPVCWEWDEHGKPVFAEPGRGVQAVGGTGFGCLLIRSSALRNHVFQSGSPHGNYDENFFAEVTQNTGYKALVDWDCVCRHYQSTDVWF
jgi:glycosyltransferase involved in cell wall biosynthesis